MANVVFFSLWILGCGSSKPISSVSPPDDQRDDQKSLAVDVPRLATEFVAGPTDCPSGTLPVPGGRVVLGQKTGDAGQDEQPIHVVRLDGFCMDRTEMTDDSGSSVRIFADWASARDACLARGGRLPTEAEFEKAARGGCELGNDRAYCDEEDMRIYPWGNGRPSCELANHSVVSPRGPQRCSNGPTEAGAPALGAGPYGHVNLSGNLWEPTFDWYHPKIYREGRPDNPGGPATGRARTLRGGAWDTFSTNMRLSNRFSDHLKGSSIGARCVFKGGEPTIESVEPLEWVDVMLSVKMHDGSPVRGKWLTVTAFSEADMDPSGLPKPGISPISENGGTPNNTTLQTVVLSVPKGETLRFSAALDSGLGSGPMPAASSGGIGWTQKSSVISSGQTNITVVVSPLPANPHNPRP